MQNSKAKLRVPFTRNLNRKSSQIMSSTDLLTDLIKKKITVHDLLKIIVEGKFHLEHRSIVWKVCLNFISLEEHIQWEESLQSKRKDYNRKCEEYSASDFMTYINSSFKQKSEALVKISESVSKDFFEQISIIKLDVERTFQEIDLFRNEEVKETLSKILYVWVIDNKDVGYCQGMNEILGTLLYALYPSNVIDSDNKDFSSILTSLLDKFHDLTTGGNNKKNIKESKSDMLTREHVQYYFYLLNAEESFEADLFHIFSEIMKRGVKDLYNYNDIKYKENYKHGLVDGFELLEKTNLSLEDIKNSTASPLKKRINKIFYLYLKIVDKELFLHIHDKVEPYIFLFRWVLCFLNREISLKYILQIWDGIFAVEFLDFTKTFYTDLNDFYYSNGEFKENFNFLDFLCVAMICNIREELLSEEDSCYILSHLMHFPNEKNIKEIMKDAVNIREKVYRYFQMSADFVIID